jgi:chromosome segregation ATPase
MEIAEETQGRGKSFTPDEYKRIRDEAKEEMRADPEILDEIKDEIRADVEDDLLSEQKHLVEEIAQHRQEALELMDKKDELINEVKEVQKSVTAEKGKLKTEQKKFSDMQEKFKPRKDDLERVNKLSRESKPNALTSKIAVTQADWDFLIGIAKQHARISDVTLAALEKQGKVTAELERCQSLYLAVASEVAALGYADRSTLKHAVQDVLKDIEDWRVVAWAVDNMIDCKPSDLAEILETREAKLNKKYAYAKKMREYNQPNPAPQKTRKQNYSHDDR